MRASRDFLTGSIAALACSSLRIVTACWHYTSFGDHLHRQSALDIHLNPVFSANNAGRQVQGQSMIKLLDGSFCWGQKCLRGLNHVLLGTAMKLPSSIDDRFREQTLERMVKGSSLSRLINQATKAHPSQPVVWTVC